MIDTDRTRIRAWRDAFNHWVNVGYSYNTARALAAVKHGQDEDVRAWALNVMLTKTNLRYEDML